MCSKRVEQSDGDYKEVQSNSKYAAYNNFIGFFDNNWDLVLGYIYQQRVSAELYNV